MNLVSISGGSWLLGVFGLAAAFAIYRIVVARPAGNEAMTALADQIHDGAMAFLKAEYAILIPFIVVVAALLGWAVDPRTSVAFVGGATCSVAAGFFGMKAATRANVRTSEAARSSGQAPALRDAFLGGSVMGLSVAALGLLGLDPGGVVERPGLLHAATSPLRVRLASRKRGGAPLARRASMGSDRNRTLLGRPAWIRVDGRKHLVGVGALGGQPLDDAVPERLPGGRH